MVVIDLVTAPQRLRGMISRYCLEVRANLFVGKLNARMRDLMWEKILTLSTAKTRAVMVWHEPTEQGYAFRTHGIDKRMPMQMDGIWLVQCAPEKEGKKKKAQESTEEEEAEKLG